MANGRRSGCHVGRSGLRLGFGDVRMAHAHRLAHALGPWGIRPARLEPRERMLHGQHHGRRALSVLVPPRWSTRSSSMERPSRAATLEVDTSRYRARVQNSAVARLLARSAGSMVAIRGRVPNHFEPGHRLVIRGALVGALSARAKPDCSAHADVVPAHVPLVRLGPRNAHEWRARYPNAASTSATLPRIVSCRRQRAGVIYPNP